MRIIFSPPLAALLLVLAVTIHARAETPQDPARPAGPTPAAYEDPGATYFRRGRELHTRGRYDEAIKTFGEYLKLHPGSELSDLMLLWRGRSQYKSGRNSDAVKSARRLREMGSGEFADLLELEILKAARGGGKSSRSPDPQ